jgi:hypothetical protein
MVIDVSDPANPQLVGGYDTGESAEGVAVSGNYVYVADHDWGLIIFQLMPETNALPQITQQPQSRTNLVGTTVTFTITASGTTPLSYQWIKNDTNYLTDDGTHIFGAATASLTLSNVLKSDEGSYRVVVTNAAGSVTSLIATLTVPVYITGMVSKGTNLVLAGTGGWEGRDYYVLASTNLALPMANWVRVATNRFGVGGTFSMTNAIDPAMRHLFFRLQVP